jgi:linoleoyl-CoA desaturase
MNTNITFDVNPEHNKQFRELRRRVKRRMKNLPEDRAKGKKYMALVLIGTYLVLYVLSIYYLNSTSTFLVLYGLLGIVSVLIFTNIIHDAVHNCIYKKRWLNNLVLYVFDIMGGNSYIWKKRHMLLHHNYQNVVGWDSDIEQAGLIKIFPQDKPNLINRNQNWLIFILYPLYLINWILIRDFKDFFLKKRAIKRVCQIPIIEYFKLIVFKTFFIIYTIGIPLMMGASFLKVLLAFIIMLTIGSVFALIFLLTPHANESNKFPNPDKNGSLKTTWLEHQFVTTNDISINNWFTRNVMGNFNLHLAHHLFPTISSVYAPEITIEIKKYAQDYMFKYRSYTLSKALQLHYRLIKKNALNINLFEEDM